MPLTPNAPTRPQVFLNATPRRVELTVCDGTRGPIDITELFQGLRLERHPQGGTVLVGEMRVHLGNKRGA